MRKNLFCHYTDIIVKEKRSLSCWRLQFKFTCLSTSLFDWCQLQKKCRFSRVGTCRSPIPRALPPHNLQTACYLAALCKGDLIKFSAECMGTEIMCIDWIKSVHMDRQRLPLSVCMIKWDGYGLNPPDNAAALYKEQKKLTTRQYLFYCTLCTCRHS